MIFHGLKLEYYTSSKVCIINYRNNLTIRHLNIWNSLSNKVIQANYPSSLKLFAIFIKNGIIFQYNISIME